MVNITFGIGIETEEPDAKLHVVDGENTMIRITSSQNTSNNTASLHMETPANKWRFFLNGVGAMNIRDVSNTTNVFRFENVFCVASFSSTFIASI